MNANENQIVVYQPNETVRLDVRLENETVWLTQAQLCELFGVVKSNVSYHLKNIFGTNELDYRATVQKIRTVRLEAGNHDFYPIAHILYRDVGIDWKYAFSPNVHFLGDAAAEIGGVRFYGTPWVPIISYSWAFEGEPDRLVEWFSKIPSGLDVLVTHSPPHIPGSDVDRSLQTDSEHFGSPELTEAIAEKSPRFVFCGHIHTGDHNPVTFSCHDGSATAIYNVSRLDERYEIAYEPTWVDM